MRERVLFAPFVLASLVLSTSPAKAGGFELPDNGTQALGRGAAFVAKASDGSAIYWNPAGLARQRGTNLLLEGNLYLHSMEFQRSGAYPDDPAVNKWGGGGYPPVSEQSGPYLTPFVAATSDFGYFERMTAGIGVYKLPVLSNRTFPLEVEGAPSPSRYDFVQTRSSFVLPTASLGFRVNHWLDLGISGHLVLANIDQTSTSYIALAAPACANNDGKHEDFNCDARTTIASSGKGIAATLGAMARPSAHVAFGATFRTPTNISTQGTFTPDTPKALKDEKFEAGPVQYELQLPWMLRLGGRYIGMDRDFELYDLELDVSYEAWATAQGLGPVVTIPTAGTFKDIQSVVAHAYTNTVGIRAGGAYNIEVGKGLLAIRGGAYLDSSATDFAFTRLDYDTLTKVAGTFGAGYRIGAFGINVAYAAVASLPRTVGTGVGQVRPINERQGGDTVASDGSDLPAVNEGAYRGFTHILSFGVSVSLEGLVGSKRVLRYGNDYEPITHEEEPVKPPPTESPAVVVVEEKTASDPGRPQPKRRAWWDEPE